MLPRCSLRLVFEAMFVLSAGFAGVKAVHDGAEHDWPGFNLREGYLGTHFADSLLYTVGDDAFSLAVISTLWFCYASLVAVVVVCIVRRIV